MRSDLWLPEWDARLRVLLEDGLKGSVIASRLNAEFGTAFTKCSVIGRKRRLGLPSAPRRRKVKEVRAPHKPEWTPARREAQGERLRQYWRDRAAGELPEKVPPEKFETIEQFLARGGTIQRIESRPDDYQPGTPVYPTAARRYGAAP